MTIKTVLKYRWVSPDYPDYPYLKFSKYADWNSDHQFSLVWEPDEWELNSRKKIWYWDLGEVKPITQVRFSSTRFNAQSLNKVVHLMYQVRMTKSNENICSSNGGPQEKGTIGWNSDLWVSIPPSCSCIFFASFSLNLTPCMTKSKVRVHVFFTLWITHFF